ncbi:pitrilysin family protein [Calothrix sp. UHCC 0171]|uniref:M16 family metallopeptidase n=1 Tax=Calothrix sp. UHCC 0171 TaxID=3110245 RepID=UPI002B21E54C|nr:pitrilysin family protein [Calothrix sp. UHCC 0171]MEA5570011.1 pitrilysin family protein [Calothrix sp. UHCC 0171]
MTNSINQSQVKRTLLNNGIVVLVTENPAADIVAARMFLAAGSCYERTEKAGLAHLLSAVMTKGCKTNGSGYSQTTLSSMEIAEAVESVGASLSTDSTSDYFVVSVKTVTADFPEILALAGNIMRFPTFPELEVELERKLALQDLRSQKEQPFSIAFEQLRKIIYQNHPYAMSALGDEDTISNLTRDDLVEFHQTYFRPDTLVISIAGRIDVDYAVKLIEDIFGDWQAPTNQPPKKLSLPKIAIAPQQVATHQNTQQSILMLGYLAPSVHSPDYAALKLLSTYLGNGLSSRLFVELREKRGLAYEVSALYPTRLFSSSFIVYMGTAPENTETALTGLRTEVDLLSTSKLAPDAIQAAKNKILGQYALGKQTNAQLAQVYGWYETLGLGIAFDQDFQDAIAAVTAEEAIASACKYLREPYISLVGQEEAIRKVLTPDS